MKLFGREYIGTVSAETTLVDKKGNPIPGGLRTGRWVLSIGWLRQRKAKLWGNPGTSANAADIRAKVEAWKAGGPLPDLDEDTKHRPAAKVIKLVKD